MMRVIMWVLQPNHLPKGRQVKETEMGNEIIGQSLMNG
jgi:hypothetical protein